MSIHTQGPAAARTIPLRETCFLQRRLQRITIPVDPDATHEYRVRYHGQRSFIRATRLQAEQVIASQLGEVRVDTIVEATEIRG